MNIKLKNISKSFNGEKVLSKFSLEIKDNDKIAIVGKSGIGKSTLLNIILKYLSPDSGSITFSETPKYSVVFQENLLFENKSIYENILFVKDISRDDVDIYLKKLSLDGLIDKRVSELSGGMKRRVSILRAILYSGNIFIFDEALKEVDIDTKEMIVNLINSEIDNRPLIFTTHNYEDIKDLKANKIINLEDYI